MFFCYPLSSGSRGNCYLFSDGISSILIDCGIGPRVIKRNIDQEVKVFHEKINNLEMNIQNKKALLHENIQNTSDQQTSNRNISKQNIDHINNQPTFLDLVKGLSYDK